MTKLKISKLKALYLGLAVFDRAAPRAELEITLTGCVTVEPGENTISASQIIWLEQLGWRADPQGRWHRR